MTGTEVEVALSGSLGPAERARYVFTDRATGNLSFEVGTGEVAAAREAALDLAGASPEHAVFMEQVHGAGVAVVGTADRGRGLHGRSDAVPGVDALVTFEPGVVLAVLVADCVPVLLAGPDGGVAAVHAGREGVRSGVVTAALDVLAPRERAGVHAVLGAAIGGCCYEVPGELRDEVSALVPRAWSRSRDGGPSLDLPGAVHAQLEAAGVTDVETVGGCTRCDAHRWFSHRAAANGPLAGRQAGLVRLTADGPGRLRRAAGAAP